VGNEEVFFDVVTTVSEGVATTLARARTITVGVVMDVTPHVTPDGKITMSVHPSATALERTEVEPTTGARAPVINTCETNTVVTLDNGKTLILAGLIQDKVELSRTGVPFISKVPLLGGLFRSTREQKNKSELVIFVTPTIMEGSAIKEISKNEFKRIKLAPTAFFGK
jgi:general secretion pathway protein D